MFWACFYKKLEYLNLVSISIYGVCVHLVDIAILKIDYIEKNTHAVA